MQLRATETTNRTWFRSERFALIGKDWFFLTREGHNIGPFGSKNEAALGFERYLEFIDDDLERGRKYAESIAARGVWGLTLCR